MDIPISLDGRYFVHKLVDYDPSKTEALITPDLAKQLKKLAFQYLETIETNYPPDQTHSDFSVYTGSGGVFLMYQKILESRDSDVLMRKDRIEKNAKLYLENSLNVVKKSKSKDRITFHCGPPGLYALAAVYFQQNGREELSKEYVQKVLSYVETASSLDFDASEILYGRAGYLSALLYLLRYLGPKSVPNDAIEKVVNSIITIGKKGATKKCPLMYEWHGKAYLGGAHGLTGILAVLLQCPSFVLTNEVTELIKKSVDYVESIVIKYKGDFPSRENGSTELIQWCHGPVGPIVLLVIASKIFKNESYLKTAQLAGEVVWQKGLLVKGAGLCHGVSGNGYSFLTLYRATKEKKWLHRAIQFGFAYANPDYNKRMRTPDRPYSLYEGLAGIVCYYIDLLDPEHSYFPGVEWTV